MAVLPGAEDAVEVALAARDAVEGLEVDGHRLHLRAGVHVGRPQQLGGDYYGRDVNIAARITDYARPREVLVSAEVMAAVVEHDDRIAFESIGPIVLKGLIDPVVLYRASP
jgi:adenylate cyclase